MRKVSLSLALKEKRKRRRKFWRNLLQKRRESGIGILQESRSTQGETQPQVSQESHSWRVSALFPVSFLWWTWFPLWWVVFVIKCKFFLMFFSNLSLGFHPHPKTSLPGLRGEARTSFYPHLFTRFVLLTRTWLFWRKLFRRVLFYRQASWTSICWW